MLDDSDLDALIAQARRGEPVDADSLAVLVAGLRAGRERARVMRDDQAALMQLARSEAVRSGVLDHALREITETAAQILGVARASVWRYDDNRSAIECLDLYRRDAQVHEAGVVLSKSDFPGYFEALLSERTIAAHEAHTDPRTAEFSGPYLTPLGIRSMLDAPIVVGGEMIGVICNEDTVAGRTWSAFDELCACALADFTALALNNERRMRVEVELRELVEVAEQRLQTIEAQRATISDLSAPIIDVSDGVLALPIVGLVDSQRSLELTEQLLERIASAGARAVIVDVTGVDVVDTMTANNLLQMLRAAKLLGAACVLCGISPQVAQTLVQLGVDLGALTVVRDLKHGIELTREVGSARRRS